MIKRSHKISENKLHGVLSYLEEDLSVRVYEFNDYRSVENNTEKNRLVYAITRETYEELTKETIEDDYSDLFIIAYREIGENIAYLETELFIFYQDSVIERLQSPFTETKMSCIEELSQKHIPVSGETLIKRYFGESVFKQEETK